MRIIKFLLAILASIAVAGCGGGGSGSSTPPPAAVVITGTAAAGAPIVGAVNAKDSKGNSFGPVTIGTDGKYNLTVTNGVAPFILQASGVVGTASIEVYSVANDPAAANLNINPLTNMVVAQATGVSPAAVFSGCTSTSCGTPVQAKVDLGQQQVQVLLQDLLAKFGITGAINLLTDAMVAGPVAGQSPLDKMLDVVNIQPVSAGSTSFAITPNSISGLPTSTVLVIVPAPPTGGVTTVATTPIAVDPSLTDTVVTTATTALTSLQGIQSQFTVMTGLFATTKPSASDSALSALFDASFNDWGTGKTDFITRITSLTGAKVGIKFTGVVAAAPTLSINNDASHQWFTFVITEPDGYTETNGPWLAIQDATSGKWLIAGNQMPTPSFDGSYSSTSVLADGYTHTEIDTVTNLAVSGNHTFTNGSSTGSFVWTGTITTSATDNRSGTISGTVTINNLGTRTAAVTGGVYMKNDGSAQMWWNATDPVYGAIGWCTTTTGAACSSSSGGGSTSPSPAPTSPASIAGTWTMPAYPDGSPAFVSMVLLADGRFMFLGENGTGGCQAMESGTYTYDAVTTNLTFAVTYDTSTTCGILQGPAASVASPATTVYSFTTAGVLSSAAGTWGTFNKLAAGTTAVGTWLFTPNAGGDFSVLINYADGRFMYAEAPTPSYPDPVASGRGLETGTYVTDSGTYYTFATLVYDGNGSTSGIDDGVGTSMPITATDFNHIAIITPDAASHPMIRQ